MSQYTQLLLIDKTVPNYEQFVDSVNDITCPITYEHNDPLQKIARHIEKNFGKLSRIGIVFETKGSPQFINNELFFDSNIINFLSDVIKKFNVQHIDFFACDTLNDPQWIAYYSTLSTTTGVIVGASNNKTGNAEYGGNWIMESTGEDIESVYFTPSIRCYTHLLGLIPIIQCDMSWYYQILVDDTNVYSIINKTLSIYDKKGNIKNILTFDGAICTIAIDNTHVYVCYNNNMVDDFAYAVARYVKGSFVQDCPPMQFAKVDGGISELTSNFPKYMIVVGDELYFCSYMRVRRIKISSSGLIFDLMYDQSLGANLSQYSSYIIDPTAEFIYYANKSTIQKLKILDMSKTGSWHIDTIVDYPKITMDGTLMYILMGNKICELNVNNGNIRTLLENDQNMRVVVYRNGELYVGKTDGIYKWQEPTVKPVSTIANVTLCVTTGGAIVALSNNGNNNILTRIEPNSGTQISQMQISSNEPFIVSKGSTICTITQTGVVNEISAVDFARPRADYHVNLSLSNNEHVDTVCGNIIDDSYVVGTNNNGLSHIKMFNYDGSFKCTIAVSADISETIGQISGNGNTLAYTVEKTDGNNFVRTTRIGDAETTDLTLGEYIQVPNNEKPTGLSVGANGNIGLINASGNFVCIAQDGITTNIGACSGYEKCCTFDGVAGKYIFCGTGGIASIQGNIATPTFMTDLNITKVDKVFPQYTIDGTPDGAQLLSNGKLLAFDHNFVRQGETDYANFSYVVDDFPNRYAINDGSIYVIPNDNIEKKKNVGYTDKQNMYVDTQNVFYWTAGNRSYVKCSKFDMNGGQQTFQISNDDGIYDIKSDTDGNTFVLAKTQLGDMLRIYKVDLDICELGAEWYINNHYDESVGKILDALPYVIVACYGADMYSINTNTWSVDVISKFNAGTNQPVGMIKIGTNQPVGMIKIGTTVVSDGTIVKVPIYSAPSGTTYSQVSGNYSIVYSGDDTTLVLNENSQLYNIVNGTTYPINGIPNTTREHIAVNKSGTNVAISTGGRIDVCSTSDGTIKFTSGSGGKNIDHILWINDNATNAVFAVASNATDGATISLAVYNKNDNTNKTTPFVDLFDGWVKGMTFTDYGNVSVVYGNSRNEYFINSYNINGEKKDTVKIPSTVGFPSGNISQKSDNIFISAGSGLYEYNITTKLFDQIFNTGRPPINGIAYNDNGSLAVSYLPTIGLTNIATIYIDDNDNVTTNTIAFVDDTITASCVDTDGNTLCATKTGDIIKLKNDGTTQQVCHIDFEIKTMTGDKNSNTYFDYGNSIAKISYDGTVEYNWKYVGTNIDGIDYDSQNCAIWYATDDGSIYSTDIYSNTATLHGSISGDSGSHRICVSPNKSDVYVAITSTSDAGLKTAQVTLLKNDDSTGQLVFSKSITLGTYPTQSVVFCENNKLCAVSYKTIVELDFDLTNSKTKYTTNKNTTITSSAFDGNSNSLKCCICNNNNNQLIALTSNVSSADTGTLKLLSMPNSQFPTVVVSQNDVTVNTADVNGKKTAICAGHDSPTIFKAGQIPVDSTVAAAGSNAKIYCTSEKIDTSSTNVIQLTTQPRDNNGYELMTRQSDPTLTTAFGIIAVTINNTTGDLYVTGDDNCVYQIDENLSSQPVLVVDTGCPLGGITVGPNGELYVGSTDGNNSTVMKITGQTIQHPWTIVNNRTASPLYGLAVVSGYYLFVTDFYYGDRNIYQIPLSNPLAKKVYVTLPGSAHAIAGNSGGTIYFSSCNPNNVYTASVSLPCFKEGAKILTEFGYVKIENLHKGDLVRTLKDELKRIVVIGKRNIVHCARQERIPNQLYKCTKDNYPELCEELILTGCHSILIDAFTSNKQSAKTREINGELFVTDDRYRLPACVDDRAQIYEKTGTFTIYHIALENEDPSTNYGIYANGLLVESCSIEYMEHSSGMKLL